MLILSYLFFWLGHTTSLLLDLLADLPRCPEWIIDVLYRFYCWAMTLSGDFDKNERIWLSRRDGETREEFEARCRAKWP